MNNLKILFLCGDLNNFGGTERVSSIIANELSESGYDISMASIIDGDKPFYPLNNKIKVTSLSKSNIRILYQTPKIIHNLRRLIKNEGIDILIVIDTMSVFFSIPAIIGLSVRHIGWEHFSFNNNFGKNSRRLSRQLAARYCDSIITLTEKDRQCWLKNTKHNSQITTIANPCPFLIQDKASVDKKETKVVLAVGRLSYLKGFDMLLEAWVKVVKDAPFWKLKIIGDGQEKDKLNDFIVKNNLIENVEMPGNTNNVEQYYEEAEIFCLSSRSEGFGMVLVEALSFGLPIVSFDCEAGPAEVLQGTDSILVPPNDIDLLASALLALINDEEKREDMYVVNKNKAELYQTENILKQWIALLEKLS